MKKLLIHIRLSPAQLRWCLSVMLVLNLLALAGTWVANTLYVKGYGIKTALQSLDLERENTIATWYSSMLLLSVAIMSVVCFRTDWQRFHHWRDRSLSYGWLVFTLVFATLSLDEIGSYHETIGDTAAFNSFGSFSGWTVFYFAVIAVGVFMLTFSFVRLVRSKWSAFYAVAGLLLFLSNPLQENYEIAAFRAAPDPSLWVRPISLLLLEEGSEIFASSCILISMVAYMLYSTKQQAGNSQAPFTPHLNISLSLPRKSVFLSLLLIVFLLGTVLTAVVADTSEVRGDDDGIPKNWFPSATAFVVFIISLYIFNIAGGADKYNRYFYLLLAFVSVSVSMYYGSNLYAHRL